MLFFLLFILGLTLGSFLNVLISRTKASQPFKISSFQGRSRCPKCRKKIKEYDNIPLLSFLILKGRCRYCRKRISCQYPLVEIFTALALIFLVKAKLPAYFSLATFQDPAFFIPAILLPLLFLFAFVGVLVAVFVYDFKTYLIPDQFVFFGALSALLYNLLLDWQNGVLSQIFLGIFSNHQPIFSAVFQSAFLRGFLGAFLAGGFFFLLVWLSREKWMGWGDVKFGIFMGLVLGFPQILTGLLLAYLLGSLVGLILVFLKKKKLSSAVPFGPFLCLGTYLALLFGEKILEEYLKLL